MLTSKAKRKAIENAALTGRARLIAEGETGLFDYEDSPGARERLRAKGRRVLAAVSVDGTVEAEKRAKQAHPEGKKKKKNA